MGLYLTNHEIMTGAKVNSQMLNQLSHPGAPEKRVLSFKISDWNSLCVEIENHFNLLWKSPIDKIGAINCIDCLTPWCHVTKGRVAKGVFRTIYQG